MRRRLLRGLLINAPVDSVGLPRLYIFEWDPLHRDFMIFTIDLDFMAGLLFVAFGST